MFLNVHGVLSDIVGTTGNVLVRSGMFKNILKCFKQRGFYEKVATLVGEVKHMQPQCECAGKAQDTSEYYLYWEPNLNRISDITDMLMERWKELVSAMQESSLRFYL